jgi:hypothetical protein
VSLLRLGLVGLPAIAAAITAVTAVSAIPTATTPISATAATISAAKAATTTATAIPTTVAATESATTAGAGLHRAGNAHVHGATIQVLAIEQADGLVRIILGLHLDKRKPARAVGHFVHWNGDGANGASLAKHRLQFVLRRAEGQVAYVQLGTHVILLGS